MNPVTTCSSVLAVFVALVLGLSPERSAASPAENPFLVPLNQPIAYAEVTADDVTEYGELTLERVSAAAARIRAARPATFTSVVDAFDDLLNELNKAGNNTFVHFWVSPDSATRAAGLAAYNKIDSLNTVLYADREIFDQISRVSASEELTGAPAKLVSDLLRDMRHEGVALAPPDLERFKALKAEITELTSEYSKNMNTDIPVLELDEDGVRGLPENFKATYATGDGTFEIPVQPSTRGPVMNNADSEETRRAYYMASNTQAAEANLPILDQLREKRHELALIMGHPTFSDYKLEVNMASTPGQVWDFLNDLRDRTQAKAEADLAQLKEFRHRKYGTPVEEPIPAWDIGYLQNAILQDEYQVDVEAIREYYPLDAALRGMMDLYQQLLDLEFRKVENASVWHEEVEFYEVYEDGALVARFYLDLFPRPNKESWFYGVTFNSGRRHPEGYELPVSMLLGNFTRPTDTLPSLVSHGELSTLFHEFGHIMHGCAYRGDFATLSGSRRDFGEAMSQVFENWIWDYGVLSSFARHYETGEVLPRETFDNMLAAKNVGSGLGAQRSVRFSMYDMMLYNRHDPAYPLGTDEIWRQLSEEFVYAPYVEGSHPQASWIHINTHPNYMYGYLWSDVYAQDMFTRFEANGLWDQATGKRYRELVLANGNQRPDDEAVEEFLGRPMNNAAYIRSLGLDADTRP